MKWCLPCFKPSTSVDRFEAEDIIFEAEFGLAIEVSLCEQVEEEEKRRTRELEKDAQIAKGLLYEERERLDNNKVELEDKEEDEQLAKAVVESLKENSRKQSEEQVKKDGELALIVQEILNMEEYPTRSEEDRNISHRALSDVDKQLTIKNNLKEKGKRKNFENVQVENDKQHAMTELLWMKMVEPTPQLERNDNFSTIAPMDEDEQQVIWESLKGKGQIKQSKDEVKENGKLLEVNSPRSLCGRGCSSVTEHGRTVDVSGVLSHPECLICLTCDKPIAIQEAENYVSNSRGNFHKSCYDRFCYICKAKVRSFGKHPYWKELYCLAHETDGTPKCCSCERLEPRGTNYVMLGDDRWLCLECMDSAVMDSDECQPLHFDMREFFEGLNMKIEKQFPFLLVEKQALNKAEKKENIDYEYEVVTRGICLSEAQIVDSVSQRPIIGPDNKLIGMATEPQRVVRECEVTAILILYGLPRLLTGYILAHEMTHAYLRLNGHRNLDNVLEEGICQVLAHMWLESQTYATADTTAASSSSSSSSTPAASASKKGEWSDFEKELVGFCKYQIETDDSPIYGVGFRRVNEMVTKSSLPETLRFIVGG